MLGRQPEGNGLHSFAGLARPDPRQPPDDRSVVDHSCELQIGDLPDTEKPKLEALASETKQRHEKMKKTIGELQESLESKTISAYIQRLLDHANDLQARGDAEDARALYRQIIDADPDNSEAHKALRHHGYDGKWFENYEELSQYRREEAKRQLEERGLVRFNEKWVQQQDLSKPREGWTKDDNGEWINPAGQEDGGE